MKTRIIVGVLCALFAIGCLVGIGYGYVAYIAIIEAAVSVLSVHEIMGVSGCKNKILTSLYMLIAAFVPFYVSFDLGWFIPFTALTMVAVLVIASLLLMLKMYAKTRFENVAIGLFACLAIPNSLACLSRVVTLCDANSAVLTRANAVYLLLMSMYCAWLNDTFALFVGMKFGKHKMSPNISPKKSIEGALGGIVGTTLFAVATFLICDNFYFKLHNLKLWMVIIGIPVLCVMGICGDLAASVIKRNYGVKDFGTLLPEHGGATDRIDSFLLTLPTVYLILTFIL